MPKQLPGPTAPRWRPSFPALLAGLALVLAVYYYFTGEAATLPLRLVPHLAPVPLVLDSVAVGPAQLPLPVSGVITTLTHDTAGPYTQPQAAGLWLTGLALALAGWLAVVSGLRRAAFLAGTVPVIFILLGLNVDTLGLFRGSQPYFLWLSLFVLGGAALAVQAYGERVPLRGRAAIFGGLVAGLAGFVIWKTALPTDEAVLQLAAYGTPAGAGLVAALLLWVGFENIRALLWFNTQAEQPENRFGLWPFVLSSLLYLGVLLLYYWNGELPLGFGLHLDPLLLLLPAVLTGWLGLRQREPSYDDWLPYAAAQPLYALLVTVAAGALGYAFATANAPLLDAARDATVLALGLLGAAFLLYTLINFGTLMQQRLRVYRVVFAPRRLPFYTVYIMGLAGVLLVQLRNGRALLDQVQAGQYNALGDLTRQQSEAQPDDLALAVLAERYYAESGDVLDRFNRPAQLGRAALYRFREQRQNELNALQRALRRQPDAKVSVHLASLLDAPDDFFETLDVLRQGRRAAPRSFALTSDLAQLFTRSTLPDSVAQYLDEAEKLAPASPVSLTNQLGYLLSQGLYPQAQKVAATAKVTAPEPALQANEALLQFLLRDRKAAPTLAIPAGPLDAASYANVYQAVLLSIQQKNRGAMQALLPRLPPLAARPANAPYYEQLVFLTALLQHALGQEVLARQQLAPLAAGTGADAGYYQYVLGMWQLAQEQFAAAATQLTLATTHGATDAQLPRAWALAYSGHRDSAQAVVRRLAASPDRPVRQAAHLLEQALADVALPATPAAHRLPPVGHAQLARARAAEAAGQPQAAALYQQAVQEAPFFEEAVLAAAHYYTRHHEALAAYEALRQGLLENPDSSDLLTAYALAAADAGLADLGQSALAQLRQQLSPAEYANLLTQFSAHQATQAAAVASFSNEAPPASSR